MGAKISANRNLNVKELYQINKRNRSSAFSKKTPSNGSSRASEETSTLSIASEGTRDSKNLPYGTLKGEDDRMNAVNINIGTLAQKTIK